jgi:hypothetical protein
MLRASASDSARKRLTRESNRRADFVLVSLQAISFSSAVTLIVEVFVCRGLALRAREEASLGAGYP